MPVFGMLEKTGKGWWGGVVSELFCFVLFCLL